MSKSLKFLIPLNKPALLLLGALRTGGGAGTEIHRGRLTAWSAPEWWVVQYGVSSGWDLGGPTWWCAAVAHTLRGPMHAEFACRFERARWPRASCRPSFRWNQKKSSASPVAVICHLRNLQFVVLIYRCGRSYGLI